MGYERLRVNVSNFTSLKVNVRNVRKVRDRGQEPGERESVDHVAKSALHPP